VKKQTESATELILRALVDPEWAKSLEDLSASAVDNAADAAFRGRVGLPFLECCERDGVELGPHSRDLLVALRQRRRATDDVMATLAELLDQVAPGRWAFFKSIKPFSTTPNDTDWILFDQERHAEVCDYLIDSGEFSLLERAPLQTTLIHRSGMGIADSNKTGGVFYIDCYKLPATDYFVYLDPKVLAEFVESFELNGRTVPTLSAAAELCALSFHNVFPERSFSIEAYLATRSYFRQIADTGAADELAEVARRLHVELALAIHLKLTCSIEQALFGSAPRDLLDFLSQLPVEIPAMSHFDPLGNYPYAIPNRLFWRTFVDKLQDPVARRSLRTQALHMLNPVFLIDMLGVLYRRTRGDGLYTQN
jgi:hypothetical protein